FGIRLLVGTPRCGVRELSVGAESQSWPDATVEGHSRTPQRGVPTKRGYLSVAVQLLWTARAGEYEIVDMDSGRSYCFIGDHPESECDWLSNQVRSQIDHCVNVTVRVTTPRHSPINRAIWTTDQHVVTASHKAPPNVRVCYVQEIASTYVRG